MSTRDVPVSSAVLPRLTRALDDVRVRLAKLPSPELSNTYAECVAVLANCLRERGTVFFVGNGGSAADAQHLAAELVGRMTVDRPPLRGIALTVDSSVLTALVNDYDPRDVFARQVQALVRAGDVLIAISTSGASENVVRAARQARQIGATTIALTSAGGDPLSEACDLALRVPGGATAGTQVMHILLGQSLLEDVEVVLGVV